MNLRHVNMGNSLVFVSSWQYKHDEEKYNEKDIVQKWQNEKMHYLYPVECGRVHQTKREV